MTVAIPGYWYTATSSARWAAQLVVDNQGTAQVQSEDGDTLATEHFTDLGVSSRLGQSPRYLTFSDGSAFETVDNDAVDGLQRRYRASIWSGLAHTLESRWRFVFVAVVLVVVMGWAGFQYGVPAAARHIAHSLPANTLDRVAAEVLVLLDRSWFAPSELPPKRQHQLLDHFSDLLETHSDLRPRVLFRKGGEAVGANAFALPDGTIIFTDEMIALARHDDELLAVLAHELGHIEHRHSLRSLVQGAILAVGYTVMVGDGAGAAELLLGLPVLMATLSYSRDHEREADAYAGQILDELGIPRQRFADIMQRLGDSAECEQLMRGKGKSARDKMTDEERLSVCQELLAQRRDEGDSGDRLGNYLSTHPALEERLREFVE